MLLKQKVADHKTILGSYPLSRLCTLRCQQCHLCPHHHLIYTALVYSEYSILSMAVSGICITVYFCDTTRTTEKLHVEKHILCSISCFTFYLSSRLVHCGWASCGCSQIVSLQSEKLKGQQVHGAYLTVCTVKPGTDQLDVKKRKNKRWIPKLMTESHADDFSITDH